MKQCGRCGEAKPLDAFHRKASSRDGRHSRCKDCAKAEKQAWYRTNRDRQAELHKQWLDNNRERSRELERLRYQRHPKKAHARTILGRAVKAGKVTKPSVCESCGRADTPLADGRSSLQAHHRDYAKPLNVEWLCIDCHTDEHFGANAERAAPEGTAR